MHALVRTVFSRLHKLDPVAAEAKLQASNDDIPEGEIKMTVSTNHIPLKDDETQGVVDMKSEPEDNNVLPASQDPSTAATHRSECAFSKASSS